MFVTFELLKPGLVTVFTLSKSFSFVVIYAFNVTVVSISSFHQLILEMFALAKVTKRDTTSLPDKILGYKEAQAKSDRFYIAAQFYRGKLPDEFTLGNGKFYGGYENAPLQPGTYYTVYLRAVTEHNGVSVHNFVVQARNVRIISIHP